ncbi:hypothetical protein JG687_00007642 [Phytophthora cactorum]|uniref:Transmembrane protein n=2 Tax=Phytophthora cactorum TaxID=29920 RepID=A0A329SZJ7_9STRA|nr:hypothetical protein Pcac1_g5248 [Phytophthora cactorum]KAG2833398.1 hypothetical protein PC112_g6517 [Phytophthora cactorum]KAG2835839.1 hypothetical protein PC111_g5279 [Phytophthora cactorum]KAG2861995.1 hypothetical protein PC113_g6689 [Phytophthora cactorum]KAG2918825.1 hypothetical protein PC114_g6706 [Phytophthora cactorum]
MLSIPTVTTSSTGGSGRHYRPHRGDAWRRRTPSVFTTSLDLKRQQLVAAQHQQVELETTMSTDTQQPDDALVQPPTPPKRRIPVAFRLMALSESDDEEESEYEPSEDERSDAGAEELFEPYQEEEQDETTESEEQEEQEEEDPNDDLRWWKSSEDKHRWEKRYKQADAAFRKRFGCAIDTPAHPETRRKLKKGKTRYQAYKFVLAGLVIVNLMQLALVYSASSWAFSMVAWRPLTTENDVVSDGVGGAVADTTSIGHTDAVSKLTTPFSQQQVPEHVRTGLYLCSSLSRRVVKSEHDVTATQHALRACDIAVRFAPLESREAIEAHVLRGDLRSLLSLFDSADEDYKAAMALVIESEGSNVNLKLAPELTQDLELKLIANRWTQLYTTKRFKELRREAKARAAQKVDHSGVNAADAVSALAADWLSAFKRKIPVLDVLTRQRGWTLRRLKYEALDDDDKIQPDKR